VNADLRGWCRMALAMHRRIVQPVQTDSPLAKGPIQVEACSCGQLELNRPVTGNGRGRTGDAVAATKSIEHEWTGHVIDVVALAVAEWLAKGGPGCALEAADVERAVDAIRGAP